MSEYRITQVSNKHHYTVKYECGCHRNCLYGNFYSSNCKENHFENLYLKCGCEETEWKKYKKTIWCDEHKKYHEESLLREEIVSAKNKVKILEDKLNKMKN